MSVKPHLKLINVPLSLELLHVTDSFEGNQVFCLFVKMGFVCLRKFFDCLFIAICIGLFILQVWDVWIKYTSDSTTLSIGFKPIDTAVSWRNRKIIYFV